MDANLISALEFMHERETKHHDNLIMGDGEVGSGKSSLFIQICYYYAYKYNKKFSMSNVFFDLEEVQKFFSETRNQIIMWDESANEGQSTQWQNDRQQKIIITLQMARKYGHFIVFVSPDITRMNYYFVSKRSIALIRTICPDNINRGIFEFYNKTQKIELFLAEKDRKYDSVEPSFVGAFPDPNDFEPLIDMEEYEKKKDEAILKVAGLEEKKEEKKSVWRDRIVILVKHLEDKMIMSKRDIAHVTGCSTDDVQGLIQKYG
jgi:hypothetical protein